MADYRKQSNEPRDYKERFEFRLTTGENIICQRYFKINNFNPISLRSFNLAEVVEGCAAIINKDLMEKTYTYLEIFAPKVFSSVDEMETYFADPKHAAEMRLGEGIVVRNSDKNYFWGKNGRPNPCSQKFDDGEFSNGLSDEDRQVYKFGFYVDGREVCSSIWEGIYPKFIRNSLDLTNRKGRFEGEDLSRLSFEQYLLYKMVEGKSDLIYNLIKRICVVCSLNDANDYDVTDDYCNRVNGRVTDTKHYKNISDKALASNSESSVME